MNTPNLYQLIYVSRATMLMTDESLEALLKSARIFNGNNNITGMLLYKDQSFLQVLEGEKDDVMALFKCIQVDDRHCRIRMLSFEEISARDFANWSMGFQRIAGGSSGVEGYSDIMNPDYDFMQFDVKSGEACQLLKIFREKS